MKKIILLTCALFIGICWAVIAATAINIPANGALNAIPSTMPNAAQNSIAEKEAALIKQGIRLVNQRYFNKAVTILQSKSLEKDATARFWLGVALYQSGSHFGAGEIFLQAAEMGNPWAMSIMSGDDSLYANSPCEYLGWACNERWADKALEGWRKLAEQGDPDAIFAYTNVKTEWWNFIPYYRYHRLLERIDKAIPNGGGYAFLDSYYLEREDLIKYLKISAIQGYAPSMQGLFWNRDLLNQGEGEEWAKKALKLGYVKVAESLAFSYQYDDEEVNIMRADPSKDFKKILKSAYITSYYYAALSRQLGGEGGVPQNWYLVYDGQGNKVYDEDGEEKRVNLMDEAGSIKIKQQAKAFAKDIKVNLFLTKNTRELFTLF